MNSDVLSMYLAEGESSWREVATRVSQLMPLSEQGEMADAIGQGLFIPSTPILRCAGVGDLNLASCHALQAPDSIGGIWGTALEAALIFKSGGGGVGVDLSRLSPRGTPLKYRWASSTVDGNVATGPVSFMKLFEITSLILGGAVPGKEPGILVSLNIEHDDFEEFVAAKIIGELRRFNLTMTSDCWSDVPSWKKDRVAERILYNGDPGLGFLDNVNRDNPALERLGWMRLFNICGEVPGWPYDVCFLASINLPAVLTVSGDYGELRRVARLIVRLLDQAIEKNRYPLRKQQEFARKNRRIGAGVMGAVDWLGRIEVDYAAEEGIAATSEVAQVYREAVEAASIELGPGVGGLDRRNLVMMSCAPTGHISRLLDVSPSIYPRLYNNAEYVKALRLTNKQHVEIVSAWQKHFDGGVSYTANLPPGATVTRVRDLLDLAHAGGIVKAISVYVDGSVAGQPCSIDGCEL